MQQFIFRPRRNGEYRCTHCGEEIWSKEIEAWEGTLVTAEPWKGPIMHGPRIGCGRVQIRGEGFWVVSGMSGARLAAFPYTWLEPVPQ